MTLKSYILITPCKNEGENLPSLIKSILLQTIKPQFWVIVDDGSTDNTPIILKDAQNKYIWIKVLRLEESTRDLGFHLAEVMNKGFEHAISLCKQTGLCYEYIGNVDGDLTIPSSFFGNLIVEFEKDKNLGIASGGTDYTIGNRIVRAKLFENEPSGGHMLIRRTCFEDCGGMPITYAADSVLKAKAKIKGWRTRRFEDNIVTEIRDVGNAEGYWNGFVQTGESFYYLNLNPIHAVLKAIIYTFRKPYYGGIAFLSGYIDGVIHRKKQIGDEDIRHYFWNKWKEFL